MRAARFRDRAVTIVDRPVPEPGPDEALIAISSAGLCHSDLHVVRGDWDGSPESGVLGHEAIGVVEALGPGAERFVSVGDRVIVGLGGSGGGYWCGACDYCLSGEPRHCAQAQPILGTFAEHFCVYAKSLVTLPDSVSDLEAPLACGGLTAYGAVKKLAKHQIRPGSKVAIIGAAGGLGHYAVQIAAAFGYEVIGIDVGAERLAFVESLGASRALDAGVGARAIRAEVGTVDACLVFSARMAGFDLGFKILRPAGLFVAVGIPSSSEGNIELNPFVFFLNGHTIVYSAVGNVQDMRELVDLAAAGKVAGHVGRVGKLSELDDILDELEQGSYVGRAVITDMSG